MYYLTEAKMADTLIAAKKRGVDVQVVLDKTQLSGRYTQIKNLSVAGVTIYVDRKHRIMHNKFCVIDGDILITGSQNWTKSSETSNAENTLIIHNNRYLCAKYIKEFNALKAQAEPYKETAPKQ
jgi:phosphatidylserine/phosphatidylglycerophosphate/cardiolipin synthase-like enzyme